MKIKIFVGFVIGVALTSAIFLATNVGAIVQDPEPIITSIAPNTGYTIGGEAVTITGRYFDEVNEVLFGTDPATIQTISTNSMVVIAPAHAVGFVDVVTTNPITSITATNAYEYIVTPPPSIISLSPSSGPIEGGTNITIAGSFLDELSSVSFDGQPATIVNTSSTQAVVTTPAHDIGFSEVIIVTPYGSTSIVDGYEYIDSTPPPVPMPPTISALNPNQGSIEGGTSMVISGLNLATVETVMIDGQITTIVSANDTELVVTTPAHQAGTVDVMVENPDGSTTFENGYTYVTEEEPPAYIFCDWHNNGKGWSEAKSNSKKKKAIVCHLQSKRKNTYKSLCLPLEAIPAHLAHGDEAGYCKEDN